MAEFESPHLRPEKPFGSKFQQQTLASFSPEHSTPAVVVCLFVVAVIFIPLGSAIIVASDAVFELDIKYSHIKQCTINRNDGVTTFTTGGRTSRQGCITRVPFTLSKALTGPIQMYYRITKFHQNYRPFARSKNDDQLGGYSTTRTSAETCVPFVGPDQQGGATGSLITTGTTSRAYSDMIYHPCGAVAWSMFNDTISLYRNDAAVVLSNSGSLPSTGITLICNGGSFGADGNTAVTGQGCTKKGIALRADVNSRFVAPPAGDTIWTGAGRTGTNDGFLAAGQYFGEPGHRVPVVTDEDFMVWSRLAGMADFVKPYRIITSNLVAGSYFLDIVEYWDSVSFGGEKSIVLSTTSWIGGKNHVLGIAYVVMGSLSLIFAAGFLVHYMLSDKRQNA